MESTTGTAVGHPTWCAGDHQPGELHVSEWEGWSGGGGAPIGHLLTRDVGAGNVIEFVDLAMLSEADGAETILRIPEGRVEEVLEAFTFSLGYTLA